MKAKPYYTLSRKYSIAKLRSFDNGTRAISINFYGLLMMRRPMQRKQATNVAHGSRCEQHMPLDCQKSKKGAIILSIFSEVKEHLTARQAAEYYGLQVKRNGMACCPFHDDKHPSMKIDNNYHCFACGVGGDAVDYVSRMFGLSQYDAALKLVENFSLQISISGSRNFNEQEKA